MERIRTSIRYFVKNERGATAIEYGLIAGLISVFIIVALQTVGTDLKAVFDYIVSANLFDSLFRGCLGPSLIVF